MPSSKHLKIALAHDYLREYGGAERVLEALHELFPEAPVFVAFKDEAALGIHWQKFKKWDIRESWITKIPGYKKIYSPLRIWAPSYFSSFDLSEYDVVISSSNAYMAKAVTVKPGAKHICYCHTPPRSLYGYTTLSNWQANPITYFFGTLINHYLRIKDVQIAQKVDVFIANSAETQSRISKFYRRESQIIFPPVMVPNQSPPSGVSREYFLYVNRLALAKHPELAVQACTELGLPLKVVGTGAMLEDLKKMAGPSVEFLGAVTDDQLHYLYQGAKALIYPVENEDFGIVPVEAMGHGVPVIAHASGGPLETVIEGQTGTFFQTLNVTELKLALQKFKAQNYTASTLWKHAQHFSVEAFKKQIKDLLPTQ